MIKLLLMLDVTDSFMKAQKTFYDKTIKEIAGLTALFYNQKDNLNINSKKIKNIEELLNEVNGKVNKLNDLFTNNSIEYLIGRYIESHNVYSDLLSDKPYYLDKDLAKDKVLKPWLSDGLNPIDRFNNNKNILNNEVSNYIKFGIVADLDINDIVGKIDTAFTKNYNSNYKVDVTETTHATADSLLSMMREYNYEKFEYLAIIDDKTTEICRDTDGEIFHITEAQFGINLPPLHVNCRSTIRPII
jgi:SPP1 gp7 family putative phage head morphogenesis protein